MSVEMNSFKQAFSLRLVRVSTSPAGTSHAFFIVFMSISFWSLTGTSAILEVARENMGLTASLLEKMKYIYSSAGKRSGHEITRSEGQRASPYGQFQPPPKGPYPIRDESIGQRRSGSQQIGHALSHVKCGASDNVHDTSPKAYPSSLGHLWNAFLRSPPFWNTFVEQSRYNLVVKMSIILQHICPWPIVPKLTT
jgi:hypothetical protein